MQQLTEIEVRLAVRDLDGDFLVDPRVDGQIDRPESSAPERREDAVFPDGLTLEEHRGEYTRGPEKGKRLRESGARRRGELL